MYLLSRIKDIFSRGRCDSCNLLHALQQLVDIGLINGRNHAYRQRFSVWPFGLELAPLEPSDTAPWKNIEAIRLGGMLGAA